MRKIAPTVAAILCAISVARAEDITTLDHKVYKNATITRTEPDGIVVSHSSGVVKIPFEELEETLRARFNYDPAKAKEFATEQARRQQELYRQNEALKTAIANRNAPATRADQSPAQHTSEDAFAVTPAGDNGINLQYRPRSVLAAELVHRSTNLMLKEQEIKASVDELPMGGRIQVNINRITVGSANTKWFTVIICDQEGKELLRKTGPNQIAQVPIGGSHNWWNLFNVNLPFGVEPFVNVYVVDAITDKRSQFRISKSGR